MQHKRPPLPAIIIVLALIGVGIYYGVRVLNDNGNGQLSASGTIESVTVNVSPEMAGKVKEVLVEEGQTVKAGDPVLSLDDSLLVAQRAVASAAVDSATAAIASAQTKYDQTLQSALAAQEAQRDQNWRVSAPTEFDQPMWFFNQAEQIAAAQTEVDNAKKAMDDALANLDKVVNDLNNAEYVKAEKRVADARVAFQVADEIKIQTENVVESGGLVDAAYDYYNAADDELKAAQKDFNALTDTKAEDDVQYARGQVMVSQQRYDAAYKRLLSLQTGAESPAVIAALNALEQAKTALPQAQSNLALIDAQMEKLTVYAPMDGVVLVRNVEPGEFVQPGATAFSMADLNNITITVYVPEDRLREISLGQKATVTIDVATGTSPTFDAEVTHIADQAEFTPRNVQTVEGRSSTVYAIKLKVNNTDNILKIGMPADVVFK
ncbi:MAG: efflux RND transporter periplasmic adaptor subunit [Anaerolineales bacterium]